MGLSGIVSQMLLLRELLIVFSGNEMSIGVILANWLVMEAIGCLFLGRLAEARRKIENFTLITTAFSLSLLAVIFLTRILKNILGVSIGESIGFLPMLFSSLLILLPVSLTHGALFTFGCKIYSMLSPQGAIGKVYIYETIGTMVGGLVWMYFLIPYFDAFQMALGLAILNVVVCIGMLARYSTRATVLAATLFLGILLSLVPLGSKIHWLSVRMQWRDLNVVHYQNSIYGNICVVENEGQYLYFLDGIPQIMTPVPDTTFVEEYVHIPFLIHSNPENILVISGGVGGVINEILKHPVKLVEYVELDPLILELIRKFPTPLSERELGEKRVRVKHIDGRLFLKTTQIKYDIIFVGLSDPSDLQANRFFTEEFFSLAKSKLKGGGILVVSIPGSLTYFSEELVNLNACILRTLKRFFPYIRVLPGDDTNLLLSSDSGNVFVESSQLVRKLRERGIEAVTMPWRIERKLHPGWQKWFEGFIETGTERINRDFEPLGVFYSISWWNSVLSPYLRGFFRLFESLRLHVFLSLLIVPVIFIVLRPKRIFIPFCIATTGFAGMMFDLLLIFAFQSIYGYVFYWIGLLVTSFMTGAVVGAMSVSRVKNHLDIFLKVETGVMLYSLVIFVALKLMPGIGDVPLKALFLLLSFISGLVTGAQFPLASEMHNSMSLSGKAGILYASDLLGGWLGGIAGGVVILPVIGLFGSCVITSLLKVISLISIVAALRLRLLR